MNRHGGVAPIEKLANFGSFSILQLDRSRLIDEIVQATSNCRTVELDETKKFVRCRSNQVFFDHKRFLSFLYFIDVFFEILSPFSTLYFIFLIT